MESLFSRFILERRGDSFGISEPTEDTHRRETA